MPRFITYSVSALAMLSLAACGGGSSGGGTTNPGGGGGGTTDATAPSVAFSPSTLSLLSGETGSSTLTATDAVGVTSGPTVTCTNGGAFSANVFTAPVTETDTTSVCTASASDAAGNTGSATLTVTVTGVVVDVEPPMLSFSPVAANVSSGGTVDITLNASDNIAITAGPSISCTNGGIFQDGVFTAPDTLDTLVSVCTATASDAAGNEGTAVLTVTVDGIVPDITSPDIAFSPSTINVDSDTTTEVVLTASDNVDLSADPEVTCTNGGEFAQNIFSSPATNEDIVSICTAVVSDTSGNSSTATLTANITGSPISEAILSGNLTYDSVPHNTATNGLDYGATAEKPVRGVTVQALDSSGNILDETVSDHLGYYQMSVTAGQTVRVRVIAQLVKTGTPGWDLKVTDNTNGNAVYVGDGSLSVLDGDQTRNIHAASGWDASANSYTATRSAAPFAILDPIYDAVTKMTIADNTLVFPPTEFRWSTLNTDVSGNAEIGQIGTSSYVSDSAGNGNVYILGDANNDTDEYDSHVIVHEWGHYFQHKLSRDNSIGGSHSGGDRLDPRVAFSEGFGNALSGMVLDDPVYRDSLGTQQSQGFSINVESNSVGAAEGWFNEASVQSILYDIYDDADDGSDTLSLGMEGVYTALVEPGFLASPYPTTIFSFIEAFSKTNSGDMAGLNALSSAQNINGTDETGAGETNDGGAASNLPLYNQAVIGGGAIEVCSINDNGSYNKLGNHTFVQFEVPAVGSYTLKAVRSLGPNNSDPDMVVYQGTNIYASGESPDAGSETLTATLPAGTIIVDLYDYNNIDGGSSSSDSCYNFTVTN